MNRTKDIFIKLTEKYLLFLCNLNEDDIIQLENGKMNIKFEIINSNPKNKKNKNESLKLFSDKVNPKLIISELFQINNREEGEKYITEKKFTRSDLELVCKELDIPFNKKDTIEKLKDKIIEGTIGFRLRSQAIQG